MASHLAPSSPTQRTRSGQLLSQEGSVLRLPEQAAWKWQLQEGVCHVPSTGSSQQHRASAGRSSPSPSRALRGTCELPARMDLHTGHELKCAFMSSCNSSGLTRCRHFPRPRFHHKEQQQGQSLQNPEESSSNDP